MAFIDEAVIKIQSGAGGNGCSSFRREKFIPKGGPDGGNGGEGGSVFLKTSLDKSSLLDFKYRPLFRAKRGQHGKGSDMDGRCGEDLFIEVPLGTTVFRHEDNELIVDLCSKVQLFKVAQGGRGGRGNKSFKSSTNRAPTTAYPGEPGQSAELRLELRLLADVGLLGLPNAGKSTLLKSISKAHPKVADYPFTTLEPHLGVVYHKEQSFVAADLPGLIDGASQGAGLGHKFLKHVTRNHILLHLVDISESVERIEKNIYTIIHELAEFDPTLLDRIQRLVFTKIDLLPKHELIIKKRALEEKGFQGNFISSHSRHGINELLDLIAEHIHDWQNPIQGSDIVSEQSNEVTL